MLAELDVVVYLKSSEPLESLAARVFGVLRSEYKPTTPEEGSETVSYEASGLGFQGLLFAHSEEMLDPEFQHYPAGLQITSQFWCVDLDTLDLEGPLSEYYAHQIAFELNVETATEVLLETTEESEIFEIRAYRRNPQFRFDQSPTTPKVFMIEARQVEEGFEDEVEEEWVEDSDEEELVEDLEREDR